MNICSRWRMVPRGEVGLIFAAIGRQLGVVTEQLFAIIVIMVILTTLITPPVLLYLLRRRNSSLLLSAFLVRNVR